MSPRIGLGCWRLGGPDRPPRRSAVELVAGAYEAGVRFFDTADCYCIDERDEGYAELVVAEALAGVTDVHVVTKGGYRRPGGNWQAAGDPRSVERAIDASLSRLGVDTIDCYLLHGTDPQVPLESSLGPVAAALEDGRIAAAGVSNVSAEEIRRARTVLPVSVVQNRLSVTGRPADWAETLAETVDGGSWFMAHTPFGPSSDAPDPDLEVWNHPVVADVAAAHDTSPAAVALAWLLQLHPRVVVPPGARRLESIVDSLRALDVELTAADVARLTAAAGEPVGRV